MKIYETKYQKFNKEELELLRDAVDYDGEESNEGPTGLHKKLLKEIKVAIKFHAKLDKKLSK